MESVGRQVRVNQAVVTEYVASVEKKMREAEK